MANFGEYISGGAPGQDGIDTSSHQILSFHPFGTANDYQKSGPIGTITQSAGGYATLQIDGHHIRELSQTGSDALTLWGGSSNATFKGPALSQVIKVSFIGGAGTDISEGGWYIGLHEDAQNPTGGTWDPGTGSPYPAVHLLGFLFDPSISSEWLAITKDGTATNGTDLTTTATGVTVVVDQVESFTIDNTDPARIVFSINGTVVAVHTTNIPTDTDKYVYMGFTVDADNSLLCGGFTAEWTNR